MDGSELLQIFRVSDGGPLWAQGAFAAAWVAAYALWAGVYFRSVDPALRRALGGWAGEPVHWVLRRGRQRGGDRHFAPRYDTWTWGLASRDDRPLVADAALYVLSLVTVYVVAALWPVAVLYGVAFHLRLLSPPFVLVLFFLVVPLYMRFWGGRWHRAPRVDAGGPMHRAAVTHREEAARRS